MKVSQASKPTNVMALRSFAFSAFTLQAAAPGTYYRRTGGRFSAEFASSQIETREDARLLARALENRDALRLVLNNFTAAHGIIKKNAKRLTREPLYEATSKVAAYSELRAPVKGVLVDIIGDFLISAGIMHPAPVALRPDPRPSLIPSLDLILMELDRVEIERALGALRTDITLATDVSVPVLVDLIAAHTHVCARALLSVGQARADAMATFSALRLHMLKGIDKRAAHLPHINLEHSAMLDLLAADYTYASIALDHVASGVVTEVFALERAISNVVQAVRSTPRFKTWTRAEILDRFDHREVVNAGGQRIAALIEARVDSAVDGRFFATQPLHDASGLTFGEELPFESAYTMTLHNACGFALNMRNVTTALEQQLAATAGTLIGSEGPKLITLGFAPLVTAISEDELLHMYAVARHETVHLSSPDGKGEWLWQYPVARVGLVYEPLAMRIADRALTTDVIDSLLSLPPREGSASWSVAPRLPLDADGVRLSASTAQVRRLIPSVDSNHPLSAPINAVMLLSHGDTPETDDTLSASMTLWELWRRELPSDGCIAANTHARDVAAEVMAVLTFLTEVAEAHGSVHVQLAANDLAALIGEEMSSNFLGDIIDTLIARAIRGRSSTTASQQLEMASALRRKVTYAQWSVDVLLQLPQLAGYWSADTAREMSELVKRLRVTDALVLMGRV